MLRMLSYAYRQQELSEGFLKASVRSSSTLWERQLFDFLAKSWMKGLTDLYIYIYMYIYSQI